MAEFLAALTGFFKFFDEVKWFVQLLQKTPAEQHADLMKRMQAEADKYAQTGRPTWD